MNVIFYNRDFSNALPLPPSVAVTVERYSHHMIGGPEHAYLRLSLGADRWETMKLLRAPVEIWDEGQCLWWGYVNKVTVPNGNKQRIGLGLDELYNYVIVAYADGDTAAGSDTNSISEYGQKEIRLNNTNATQTEAEQSRGLYLVDHQDAREEMPFSGGGQDIEAECYGWYNTLGWKYYTDADTTNTENTTQISAMVTGAGQFFAGSIIEATAGITSNENRDGHSTALTYINQLLNAGTTNVRPLLARVDRARYLHVYERSAEPPTNAPDYLWRGDGKLETPLGQIVPDKECKTAVWAKPKDIPSTLGGFSAIGSFFIERAEYNAERNETTYTPASAYEQVRLAKFFASVLGGGSDGSGGVGSTPIFWTPEAAPLTYNMKHVYSAAYAATDIATSSYLHAGSGYGYGLNIGFTGLVAGTVGGGSAYPAWIAPEKSWYIIWAYASVAAGTSVPTDGWVELEILWMNVANAGAVTFAENRIPWNTGGDLPGTQNVHVSGGAIISDSAAQGFMCRIVNGTDGDIRVSNLNVLFWKVR